MRLSIADGLAEQTPSGADEERLLRVSSARTGPARAVARQRGDRARVQRHEPRLAELAAPDRQHPGLQIDIRVGQRECLRDAQTGAGDQAEQRLHDGAAQAARRPDADAAASSSAAISSSRKICGVTRPGMGPKIASSGTSVDGSNCCSQRMKGRSMSQRSGGRGAVAVPASWR